MVSVLLVQLSVALGPGPACGAEPPVLVTRRAPGLPLPAGGGGDSGDPIISADGRFVLFSSAAQNLVAAATNSVIPVQAGVGFNLYLHDRSAGTNVLLTEDSNGCGASDGWVIPVAISTNGRYVLFESEAAHLVPQDTNEVSDIFLRDLVDGTTSLISANLDGFAGRGGSHSAAMTPDGRYVVFASVAADLVTGDTNNFQDIFLRDVQTGATTLISERLLAPGPLLTKRDAGAPQISADGRFILYSQLSRLESAGSADQQELYLCDIASHTTLLASAGAAEAILARFGTTRTIVGNFLLSDDAQHVVYFAGPASGSFQSMASLLFRWNRLDSSAQVLHTNAAPVEVPVANVSMTPDAAKITFVANVPAQTSGNSLILLWDAAKGTTTLVSADLANRVPDGSEAFAPYIDQTGRFVVFLSSSDGLVTNTVIPGAYHVYLRDLELGVTTLVDADPADQGSGADVTTFPQVSAGGHFVVFHAPDGSLVPDDFNAAYDVFLRDMSTATAELLSSVAPGWQNLTPNQSSSLSSGSTSAPGIVAFTSSASDLVPGDTNDAPDIFVRDLSVGTNALVSVNTNGVAGNGSSSEPWVSADGRYVVFTSYANDLVRGVRNSAENVYLRDLLTATTTLISLDFNGTGGGDRDSYSPVISEDGRFVVFQSVAANLVPASTTASPKLLLRDLQLGTTTLMDTRAVNFFALTPDGRYIAYAVHSNFPVYQTLYVWDTSLNARISTNAIQYSPWSLGPLVLSPNGRFVVSSTFSSMTNALMVFDRSVATNWFVPDYRLAGNSPIQFAADNRSFTYVGTPHTSPNAAKQIISYEIETRQNTLVSTAFNATAPGNDDSDSPSVSPDGRLIAYRSSASDLVPGDTNNMTDIFVYDRQSGATVLLTTSRFGPFPAFGRSSEPMFSPDGQWLFLQSFAADLVPNDFNNRADIFAYRVVALSPIPLFLAQIVPSSEGVSLAFPVVSGKTYRVQFKDSLGDEQWKDAAGEVTIIGTQGSFREASLATHRFYRVMAF